MITRALFIGIKQRMIYDKMSIFEALRYEYGMICVMGFVLYIRYNNGIAKICGGDNNV